MSASGNGKDYGNGIGITDVCEVPLRRKCLTASLQRGWKFQTA